MHSQVDFSTCFGLSVAVPLCAKGAPQSHELFAHSTGLCLARKQSSWCALADWALADHRH
jgi:hypothetical protein